MLISFMLNPTSIDFNHLIFPVLDLNPLCKLTFLYILAVYFLKFSLVLVLTALQTSNL